MPDVAMNLYSFMFPLFTWLWCLLFILSKCIDTILSLYCHYTVIILSLYCHYTVIILSYCHYTVTILSLYCHYIYCYYTVTILSLYCLTFLLYLVYVDHATYDKLTAWFCLHGALMQFSSDVFGWMVLTGGLMRNDICVVSVGLDTAVGHYCVLCRELDG